MKRTALADDRVVYFATHGLVAGDVAGLGEPLRNAMLTYMNDKSSPLNAYPAFWAPFSIIGEGAAR